jgi:hypothetical protein
MAPIEAPESALAEPERAPAEPGQEHAEPEQARAEPAPEADPTGPLSPDRLDDALKRLRQEIPAPSEESPREPSA